MAVIIALALIAMFALGFLVGFRMSIERYEWTQAQRQADEEKLAEKEELYAAWAALKAHSHRRNP
jgi:hypothetical protein